MAQSGDFNYDIPAGDSVAVAISNAFTVSTGTYHFGIIDENTQKVSGLQRVVVLDVPADEAVITMAVSCRSPITTTSPPTASR